MSSPAPGPMSSLLALAVMQPDVSEESNSILSDLTPLEMSEARHSEQILLRVGQLPPLRSSQDHMNTQPDRP